MVQIMKEVTSNTLLKDLTFSVVDIETNGMSPTTDNGEILEIAMIDVVNKEINMDSCYSTLIKPQNISSKYIKYEEVHHISYDDIKNEHLIDELIPEIGSRLENKIFVAHNARFDHSFVDHAFNQITHDPKMKPWINLAATCEYKHPYLDTLAISRRLYKAGLFSFDEFVNPKKSHSLDQLIYKFLDSNNINSDIDFNYVKKVCPTITSNRLIRHGALYDTYKTAMILIKFLELLEEKDVYTLSDLKSFLD